MKLQDLKENVQRTLILEKLPYSRDALQPVLSKDIIDFHYGKLARGYVDRFNNHEGDAEFNKAGAYLHNMFFSQFQPITNANAPIGKVGKILIDKFDDFKRFTTEFKEAAIALQGSGWVYLSQSGDIKIIKNHKIVNDILFILDLWEHAFQIDYRADKAKYVDSIWRVVNWNVINDRL